jgi:malonyl-CoA O-methyltransferase
MASDPFENLAACYDQHAAVAAEAGLRLIERLDGLRFEPKRIVELGCATGRQLRTLRNRFPRSGIVGLDNSGAMLGRARKQKGWWRPRFELLQASLLHLPLAADTVDMVYANLTPSWSGHLNGALLEMRRVLKPGGLALVSMLGPDTLNSGRLQDTLLPRLLVDVQALGSELVKAGFTEPVLDTDWLSTSYSSVKNFEEELRGAGLLQPSGPDPEVTSGRPDECPTAQWEIVSASAWAPLPGQPVRGLQGEEVSIPVESIGRRQRS